MAVEIKRGYARGYEDGAQTLTDYMACESHNANGNTAADIINTGEHPQDFPACPSPLSGEWTGESIPELFGLAIGAEPPTEEELDEYEDAYIDGWHAGIHDAAGDWLDREVTATTWRIYRTHGAYLDGHTGTEYPTRDAARDAADELWENDTAEGWKNRGLIVANTPEYALAILNTTHGDTDPCARCYEPDTYCTCY
jgi:hypothetical protein